MIQSDQRIRNAGSGVLTPNISPLPALPVFIIHQVKVFLVLTMGNGIRFPLRCFRVSWPVLFQSDPEQTLGIGQRPWRR